MFVAVFNSMPRIAQLQGEEALEIAEKLFVDTCRLATQDATAEARLSHMIFAAFWPALGKERHALDVLARWFPMQAQTPHYELALDVAWFVLEVSPAEASRDVFERLAAKVGEEPLPRGWDGQVG